MRQISTKKKPNDPLVLLASASRSDGGTITANWSGNWPDKYKFLIIRGNHSWGYNFSIVAPANATYYYPHNYNGSGLVRIEVNNTSVNMKEYIHNQAADYLYVYGEPL